jgi:uncharacterized membrane protein
VRDHRKRFIVGSIVIVAVAITFALTNAPMWLVAAGVATAWLAFAVIEVVARRRYPVAREHVTPAKRRRAALLYALAAAVFLVQVLIADDMIIRTLAAAVAAANAVAAAMNLREAHRRALAERLQ